MKKLRRDREQNLFNACPSIADDDDRRVNKQQPAASGRQLMIAC